MSTKTSSDKIAINGVEIEIGGNKIKLTLEQVAELKKILAKAFPEKETERVYIPAPPTVIYRDRPWHPWYEKYRQWEVTCQSTAGNSSSAMMCLSAGK